MTEHAFYTELGKILYAVAKADGAVQEKELKEIEKGIQREIKKLHQHKDDLEFMDLLLTKLSFQNSMKANLSMREASLSFMRFLEEHGDKIPDRSKQVADFLINLTARAYHGINKEEDKLLKEIKKLLTSGF
jgi:hypothetical protein